MKKLIFILLILPVMVWGQRSNATLEAPKTKKEQFDLDQRLKSLKVYNLSQDTTVKYQGYWTEYRSNHDSMVYKYPKRDTVKVVMLVCDTSTVKSGYNVRLKNVWWVFGYLVRNITYKDKWLSDCMFIENSPVYQNLFYLTEDKAKIPVGMIVWDSREVK